jgi:surface antigen
MPADLSAFGPALLMKTGCEAVVAYQYPVKGELTQKFNAALYGALVEGTPLEMATQVARKKVWASDSEGRAFLSPAVFVRNPGGLRLAPAGPEAASRSRVGALSGHA